MIMPLEVLWEHQVETKEYPISSNTKKYYGNVTKSNLKQKRSNKI